MMTGGLPPMRGALLAALILVGGGALAQSGAPGGSATAPGPARTSVEDQIATGTSLLNRGRYEDAIRVFNLVLARMPNYGPALASRALAYAWTNRLDEATRDLDAAARDMPESALLHRVRASIAQRRSDDATALAEFSRSLELEPGNPLALRSRAYLYQRAGNHAAALADADTYIAAYPYQPDGYVLKADLLSGQRERSLAAAEADRLSRLFPDDPDALASAARIYDLLAERERALAAINGAIERVPDLYYYRLLRSQIRRWDDFAGRRADLESALALDPGNGDAITGLAVLDFKEGKWREAIARFSALLALEPRDFGLLAYRAMARLNAGERESARRDFENALAVASGADDFSLICNVFAREGIALDWGLDACNRALSLNPNESPYRANRALVELRLGRLDAALADYDGAIAADSRRADGYYGRAIVRQRRGEREAAAADRAEALAIDPGIAEVYRGYGLTDF